MTGADERSGRAMTDEERRRYARQLLLPGFGVAGQDALIAARVLVIGAGGLGSVTAPYLAAAGVGTIGIVDDDVVDESNLQRQLLHDTAAIGMPKVESAAARLSALNPLVTIEAHPVRLTAANAVELIGNYDLVVDGADNFATRYLVADAAALTGRPHIWGSILRFDGQVSVWWPPHGPCYRCVFPEPPPAGSVASCAEAGVFGSLCAAIGAVQASEAIKLLSGLGEPLIGRLLVHDALAATWATVPVRANPECAVCGAHRTITAPMSAAEDVCRVDRPRLDVAGLAAALTAPDVLLVDVREPVEWATGVIGGAHLIALGDLASAELPRDRRIVLYCAAGGRSARGVTTLSDLGYESVTDLAGGIGAWAAERPTVLPRS